MTCLMAKNKNHNEIKNLIKDVALSVVTGYGEEEGDYCGVCNSDLYENEGHHIDGCSLVRLSEIYDIDIYGSMGKAVIIGKFNQKN